MQSMQFISLRPNVVLIDMDNKVHVIRKGDQLQDLEQCEQMPEYLSTH
jgi:23S rRNA U2552 (ribose-2'-O)-methylase RlmE/FtsJ